MESLIQMDDLSALVAPDMSTDAPDWCENCQVLRQNIKKLEQEQEQSFVKLKQKIISTDLLIKKYKSKCEDYDIQFKKNEESTKRADKFQRQSEILETQLKATLMETEPLRAAKASMETEIKQKDSKIVELQNKLVVAEGAQRQYEHLTKSTTAEIEKLEAEKRDLNGRIKVLEGGKITKETARELKGEISMLKKENTGLKKNEKRLERKLKSALSKIEELTEKLKECRTMPAERRRKGTGGSFLSPLRSPSKSPRVRKISPSSSPKKTAQKSSPKQPIKAIPMNMKQSESENSNVDDDDDDDDIGSVYKFAFSPVMPCLSPLPPSPACFKHPQRQMSTSSAQFSDEENLSDMADELEQQLFGDFKEEDSKDGKEINAKKTEHGADVNNSNKIMQDKTEFELENDTNVAKNVNEEKNDVEMSNHESKSRNTDAMPEIDQHQNSDGKVSACDTDSIIQDIDYTLEENNSALKGKSDKVTVTENVPDSNDKTVDRRSVKERLASSIKILSPTANRKPHPCSEDYVKDKLKAKSEFSSPERSPKNLNTSKEKDKCIKNNQESKGMNPKSSEQLSCNNTREFEAIDTESDSSKKDMKHSEKDPCKLTVEKDDSAKGNDKVDQNVTVESIPSPSIKQVISDSKNDKKEDSDLIGEIKVDIIEETVPVQLPGKTPALRGYLTRQQCVNTQGERQSDSHRDSDRSKDKVTKCEKQNLDSSFGESEDEVGFLQNTHAYTVLQREIPQRMDTDPKRLRNIKKKLRSTFKFKDHDSASSVDHHKEQEHITSAFTKHDSRDKHQKEKVIDKIGAYESIIGNDITKKVENTSNNFSTEESRQGPKKIDDFSVTYHELNESESVGTTSSNSYQNSPVDSIGYSSIQSGNSEDAKEKTISSNTDASLKNSENEIVEKSCTQIVNKVNNNVNSGTDIPANSLGLTNDKLPISPSRQLSTGFVVHSSVERTPSTESPTSIVEIIDTVCDKDNVRSRSPLTRQKHVICETISEEVELDLGNGNGKKLGDRSNMILGIDDLFADQEENSDRDNADFSRETLIFGSKPGTRENKAIVNEHLSEDSKHQDKILLDNSNDFNIDNETVNVDIAQCSRNSFSDSFSIAINKPGCSFEHEDIQSSVKQSSIDGESVVVTPTSCPIASPRLLTCTPDNIDNEHLTVCQSQSRSTTPSICSIDTAMPPLSPLSMSPFDFIIPISPLPPSPVRQVDRVSPLSPENLGDINETVDSDIIGTVESEQSVSNENEKNVGNIPEVRTPERTVLEKVISDSPLHVPDLISPIRTPKQKQSKKIKEEKPRNGTDKSEHVSNKPIKFVSSVPTGVLTVKPKQETSSLHSNLNTTTKVSAIGKKHAKDISLRKHVALKKSIDISSNLDSVFVRKSRHTVSLSKTSNRERLSVKQTTPEGTGDISSKEIQLMEHRDNDQNNVESVAAVDETGDNSKEKRLNEDTPLDTVTEKDCRGQSINDQDTENVKVSENMNSEKRTITYEKPVNELNSTNVGDNVNDITYTKSQIEKDGVEYSKEAGTEKLLKVESDKKSHDSSKKHDQTNKRKLTNDDRTSKCITHQLPKQIITKFSKTDTFNKTGCIKDKNVLKEASVDQVKNEQPAANICSEDHKPDKQEADQKPNKPEADELPAGYDPLIASKRKARMAHQPRSHPVIVKKPPVIIEPFFQPQTTRRKRKSQESSDKDPTPRKQAKQLRGPLFQRPKGDETTDPARQELARKLESFLKSNEKLETFCRNVATISENKLGNNLIEICVECIGRFRGDCLDLVYQSCEEEGHIKLEEEFPLLNNVEKKAVLLLCYITKTNQKEVNKQGILKIFWDGIFTKELTISMTGKMSLARLYTAVCLQEGDVEQVRVLLYHIAMCGFLNHWLFVVPIASVWPEVLSKPLEPENNHHRPVLLVYEYLVTNKLLGQDTESSHKVLKIMEKLCNWSRHAEHPEIVLRQLTTGLFELHTEQQGCDIDNIFEVVQACKLLLKNETWSWCNEYFINRQGLQPAYNRYMCKKGTVSSTYVCAVLDITGFTIACHSEHIKQREISQICKTWILSMMSKEEGDPEVQNCCLETLLEMSVFNPSIIIDIHVWLQKNPSHSLHRNLHRLEILRQTFKEKFGLTCEPYVK